MKFTKHHNHVARKNLRKARKVKLAGGASSGNKEVKRVTRQVEPKKSAWSLSSLLKNVTSYFTGESEQTQAKKRPQRKHPSKKSAKSTSTTATTAATTTTAAKK